MSNSRPTPGNYAGKSASLLQAHTETLRAELRRRDLSRLAENTQARLLTDGGGNELRLDLWDREVALRLPDFVAYDVESGRDLGTAGQALILYHLMTSNGADDSGRWIAFTELPDGRFYTQAFQGYTGRELLEFFGDDVERFEAAVRATGGIEIQTGDRAYAFQMLPRVKLALVYWRGDEDFPSSYQVLFEGASAHHLPTDACAIAGSMLVRRVMAAAGKDG